MGFFSLRGPRVAVHVHLNARLQPMHRHSIYEDSLDWMLRKVLKGGKLTGGGSLLHPERGVEYCDIELEIVGDRERAQRVLVQTLESLGAPRGSWLQIGDGSKVSFGKAAGVKLAFDGVRLPKRVYEEGDISEIAATLQKDLRGVARMQSWWVGPRYTELYFYGKDEARIRSILDGARDRFPLAQLSVVETIA